MAARQATETLNFRKLDKAPKSESAAPLGPSKTNLDGSDWMVDGEIESPNISSLVPKKMEESESTVFLAALGLGFPLHKPYIQLTKTNLDGSDGGWRMGVSPT